MIIHFYSLYIVLVIIFYCYNTSTCSNEKKFYLYRV